MPEPARRVATGWPDTVCEIIHMSRGGRNTSAASSILNCAKQPAGRLNIVARLDGEIHRGGGQSERARARKQERRSVRGARIYH